MSRAAAASLVAILGLAACSSSHEAAAPTATASAAAPTASAAATPTSDGASTTTAGTEGPGTEGPGTQGPRTSGPGTPHARTPGARTPRPAHTGATLRPAGRATVAEPTTTNTLPPPPPPSRPAPSTAGRLAAGALPVPAGWHPVVRAGGSEEGYQGNGTWVHARDPRYAASDVVTLGCADVTRDDYPDPVAALEGTYEKRRGEPGIGLVLQFAGERQALAFYGVYLDQVRACRSPDSPIVIRTVPSPLGLIDHRTAPDADWTEVARRTGSRVTLIILTDPGHHRSRVASESLLRQIRS